MKVGDVTVELIPAWGKPLLDRLLQLYLHDFSDLAPLGTSHGEVDAEGRFAYPPGVDGFWREPGHAPLLIRADGRIAGFALVNGWPPLDRPLDHALAEFFVLRKHRRAGVGRRAARTLFRSYPGRWQIGIAAYNAPALAFWRAVARDLPDAEERAGAPDRWPGTVLCFTAAGTD